MNWGEYKKQIEVLEDHEIKRIELVAELVARRKNLGMTQKQLAEKTGLKQSAIARLERDGSVPKLDTLTRIADALDLKVQLMVEEEAATVG